MRMCKLITRGPWQGAPKISYETSLGPTQARPSTPRSPLENATEIHWRMPPNNP